MCVDNFRLNTLNFKSSGFHRFSLDRFSNPGRVDNPSRVVNNNNKNGRIGTATKKQGRKVSHYRWKREGTILGKRSGVIVQPVMAPLQETSIRARARLCLPLFARNMAVKKVRYARARPTVKFFSFLPVSVEDAPSSENETKTFKYKTRRRMFRFRVVPVT